MINILKEREELILRYNQLKELELSLYEQVNNGLRNNDIHLAIEKEQITHAINKVLAKLVETQIPIMEDVVGLSEKAVEKYREEIKLTNNQNAKLKLKESEERYIDLSKTLNSLKEIVLMNENDLHEIDVVMNELVSMENTANKQMLEEALTNVSIVKGFFKICCMEGENETFDYIYKTRLNLLKELSKDDDEQKL